MAKIYLLFSHTFTEQQFEDAANTFGITEKVALPEHLQTIFSNIPAHIPNVHAHLQPVRQWLEERLEENDILLVQGEFGATVYFVLFAKERGLKAVYSTTEREVAEKKAPDGSVVKYSRFRHVRFREY